MCRDDGRGRWTAGEAVTKLPDRGRVLKLFPREVSAFNHQASSNTSMILNINV